MEHLAIDLGGRESQICVRSSDGTILEERTIATRQLGQYLRGRKERSRVILETCAEAFGVADQALASGHEVRVVPATLAKALGVGARGVKNDRDDARNLSVASCRMELPSVHIPSAEARRRKAVCGTRDALVTARTRLIQTVWSWLRASATRPRSGTAETFPTRVRAALPTEAPPHVARLLEQIEALTVAIRAADVEVAALADGDPVCARLMTVPGVGPVTAVRFAATLDEVGRFARADRVASYLGLTPGQHSSGGRDRLTHITKAGSAAVRRCLVQASWVARRYARQDPLVQWALQVEARRGKHIAIVAQARKLAGILFALWRDGTRYEPRRGATVTAPTSAALDLHDVVPLTMAVDMR
jgi:transposase